MRLHRRHFLFKLSCRDQTTALSAYDDLLQSIGGCHRYIIFRPIFMSKLLNKLIGSLRLLRINHMYIVIIEDLGRMPLHPVRIKHNDQIAFPDSLIITENIHQTSSCPVNIYLCKFI